MLSAWRAVLFRFAQQSACLMTVAAVPAVNIVLLGQAAVQMERLALHPPQKKKTPIGAIAGGCVGGVVLIVILASGIFIIVRRRRNRTPPPARDTGILATPTPAKQKHGSESAYFPPPAQPVVSTLPTGVFVMPPTAGGYSQHEVGHAQPMPSNLHAPYSETQVVYAATADPTNISSPGGTQPTNNWSP
ncbi:hypothetical protein C8R45DRAFT_947056 [Mycena sanguinolenta]|nr:hypothetical protein C8R45DRAFT_947056 [Mycena sanguinolenta]